MGWRSGWFGSETPTRAQIAKPIVALGLLALMALGMFVNFVPAPLFHGTHVVVAFLLLGVVETGALFAYANRNGTLSTILDKGFLKFVFTCFVVPPMLGFGSWLVVGKCIPWGLTRIVGSEYRQQALMQTHYTRSRRSCDYRLQGGPMERAFPGFICIREDFYRRHPEQSVPVTLVGKRSIFGVSVQDVHGVDRP